MSKSMLLLRLTIILISLSVLTAGCGGGGGSTHGGATVFPAISGEITFGGIENGELILYEPNNDGDVLTTVKTITFTTSPTFARDFEFDFDNGLVIHVTKGRYTDANNGVQYDLKDFVTEVENSLITLQSLGAALDDLPGGTLNITISVLTDLQENLTTILEAENFNYRAAASLARTWVSDYFGFDIMTQGMTEVVGLSGNEQIDFDTDFRYALIQVGLFQLYSLLAQEIDIALEQELLSTNHTDVMALLLADILDGTLDFMAGANPIAINPDADVAEQIFFNAIRSNPGVDPPTFFPPINDFLTDALPDAIEVWLDSAQNKTIWDSNDLVAQQFITFLRSRNGIIRADK